MPFVEFERAALCRGEAPEPFGNGREVPFEFPFSPSTRILGPSRLRLCRCSFADSLELSGTSSLSWESEEAARRLRPRTWFEEGFESPVESGWDVLLVPGFMCVEDCSKLLLCIFGAERDVLRGKEGEFGVDGSSGVDGDDVEYWE